MSCGKEDQDRRQKISTNAKDVAGKQMSTAQFQSTVARASF